MKLVVIESPFAGDVNIRKENINYLRRCLRDSLMQGEAPFASHAIYTQYGVLDDSMIEERRLGIEAGFRWGRQAFLTAVYIDRGISGGMRAGIMAAKAAQRPVVIRVIESDAPSHDVAAAQAQKICDWACECGGMWDPMIRLCDTCAEDFRRLFRPPVEINIRLLKEGPRPFRPFSE